MVWTPGEVVIRRDVWRGSAWVGLPVYVIEDRPDLLAVYLAGGSEIGIAPGDWPVVHPWSGRGRWSGHGVVMLHRPGEPYAVWVFWEGPGRAFALWYVNLQAPLTRTARGFDTLDRELDLLSRDGKVWHFKDDENLEARVAEGRMTPDEVAEVRADGARLHAEMSGGGCWWDASWALWTPPSTWRAELLSADWYEDDSTSNA